ncbi:MAG TPA: GFA family protein [Steroidobacteraceae bacterium]|nr:GFA family protein [Steroidobacteraceae bacterium]
MAVAQDPPERFPSRTVIKQVGTTLILRKHRASCHCRGVVLELDLPDGIVDARRCNCSMCRRKGALMGAVSCDGLHVVQGQELLTVYRFNTKTAEHYFCSRCGIYTHHRRRSKPNQYGYNVGCLEGVDPYLIAGIPINDGVNHPADRE